MQMEFLKNEGNSLGVHTTLSVIAHDTIFCRHISHIVCYLLLWYMAHLREDVTN